MKNVSIELIKTKHKESCLWQLKNSNKLEILIGDSSAIKHLDMKVELFEK